MNYTNYNMTDLTTEIILVEESLMGTNHDMSAASFSVLLSRKNILIEETVRRGLVYSDIVRNQF